MAQAEELFHGDYWDNDAARIANRVAMHIGMRADEIAALRVKDILLDGIHVLWRQRMLVLRRCLSQLS